MSGKPGRSGGEGIVRKLVHSEARWEGLREEGTGLDDMAGV